MQQLTMHADNGHRIQLTVDQLSSAYNDDATLEILNDDDTAIITATVHVFQETNLKDLLTLCDQRLKSLLNKIRDRSYHVKSEFRFEPAEPNGLVAVISKPTITNDWHCPAGIPEDTLLTHALAPLQLMYSNRVNALFLDIHQINKPGWATSAEVCDYTEVPKGPGLFYKTAVPTDQNELARRRHHRYSDRKD